ncbi:hypothetical protein [Spirosoma endbachense]|nr:hypothetical protein [Spirosoma endbachense]
MVRIQTKALNLLTTVPSQKNNSFRDSPLAAIASTIGKPAKGRGVMSNHDSSYLIEQLLKNNLSSAELDTFLAGLHNDEAIQAYSDVLETYFNELLKQNEHQPESDKQTSGNKGILPDSLNSMYD